MKLGNKISFGVQAVQAGQKSSTVNAAPQLIANSTSGKFVITSPVSKALNVAVGENVMFLNNIQGVEAAIQARVEDVVNYAAEKGIDINTREGEEQLLAVFTQWYIAKGVKQYDSKGNPIEFKKVDFVQAANTVSTVLGVLPSSIIEIANETTYMKNLNEVMTIVPSTLEKIRNIL